MQGLIESRSMELSLDPPVSSLADAAFELLRSQNWFDAILIIDDSTASDILSYRLRRLCRRKWRPGAYAHNAAVHPSMVGVGPGIGVGGIGPGGVIPPGVIGKGDRYEARRKNWQGKTKSQEYRRADSAWARLKVIQLSKNMLQKEVSGVCVR